MAVSNGPLRDVIGCLDISKLHLVIRLPTD